MLSILGKHKERNRQRDRKLYLPLMSFGGSKKYYSMHWQGRTEKKNSPAWHRRLKNGLKFYLPENKLIIKIRF